jgi:hypothetical protein
MMRIETMLAQAAALAAGVLATDGTRSDDGGKGSIDSLRVLI